jgi:transcriptional regulator with XRE-family HTH domain
MSQRTAAEIRAELARQKKSGRWLAEKIGAPSGTVARWVAGDTAPPLDAIYAMCRALGINVADLVANVLRDGDVEPVIHIRGRRAGDAADNGRGTRGNTHGYVTLDALVA